MAFVLFICEIMLALSFDREDRFSNAVFIVLMYFTYCQLWLYVILRAAYLTYIKKEKLHWDKTVRFDIQKETGTPAKKKV